jgi:hypothetical protein
MLQYYLVRTDHPDKLDEQVNERLAQGWQLQGGVSMCAIPNPNEPDKLWWTYAQAMVREVKEEKAVPKVAPVGIPKQSDWT